MNKYQFITIVYAVMLGLLLAACSATGAPTPVPTVLQPTATPAPTATAVALPTLESPFRDQVVNAFNIADYDWINAHMGSEFTFAGWRAGSSALPPTAAVDQLRTVYFGRGSQPAFQLNADAAALLGGVDPLSLWGPDVTATDALYLTGLGSSAQDEALLILAVYDDGTPYIFGLLSAFGGFAAYPNPPGRELVDQLTAVSAEAIAYVQNEQLFIRTLPDGQPVLVEASSCVAKQQCMVQHLKWSPDGQYLLFYSYFYDGVESASRLHVSDRQGNVQTINDTAPFYPGAWSPDGRHIAFMRSTDIPLENPDGDTIGAWQYEVWRVPLTEGGALGAPQLVGPWTQIGDGCGGGGRSLSETLYEYEGGTSYGYMMGIMVWTPQDILLHTFNCDNIGIGRYDLAAQTELPGFVRPLRNLVLNASGDRWYAITDRAWSTEPGSNELVTGTPDSPEVTVIPTSAPLELLFIGQFSGNLYYTERTALGREEISDRGLFFAYYQSALWQIRSDSIGDGGEEQLLFGEDDHAYAQVTETAVGDLLFVLVENERPLFAAAQDPQLDTAALTAYYPQRHIMQLPAGGGKPVMILTNAGQPALTFP